MEAQVPEAEKTKRLHRLQAVIARQQRDFNAQSVGKTIDVLLEKPGRLPGQLTGRTPYLQTVQVMAPRALIGSVVKVAVTELGTNTLFGHLERVGAPALAAAGA
jgi:tRNA-2-methylthio-N6-dimethylallyladenosine synthase